MSTPTIDFTMIEMLRGLRAEGEADPLIELTEAFESDGRQRLQELRDAITAGDERLARRAAHSLKGISGSIGASRMSELSASLERAEPGAINDARVQEIQQEFERASTALRSA
jgi:HPt (histidine-containing phosphotransfer) domain-containing protein